MSAPRLSVELLALLEIWSWPAESLLGNRRVGWYFYERKLKLGSRAPAAFGSKKSNRGQRVHRGYLKLWRRLEGSRIFKNEGLLKVWIWCLIKASHKKRCVKFKTGKGDIEIEIKPGQFIFGRRSASENLDMKQSTVWKRIKKLENLKKLNIESNRQYSIINIVNWDIYQADAKKSNSERNKQGTSKEHKQECKECKNMGEKIKGEPTPRPVIDKQETKNQNPHVIDYRKTLKDLKKKAAIAGTTR